MKLCGPCGVDSKRLNITSLLTAPSTSQHGGLGVSIPGKRKGVGDRKAIIVLFSSLFAWPRVAQ